MVRTEPLWSWDNRLRDIYRTIGNVGWLSRAFCSECGGSVASAVCLCLAPHPPLPAPAAPGVVYTEGALGRLVATSASVATPDGTKRRGAFSVRARVPCHGDDGYESGSDVKTDRTEEIDVTGLMNEKCASRRSTFYFYSCLLYLRRFEQEGNVHQFRSLIGEKD